MKSAINRRLTWRCNEPASGGPLTQVIALHVIYRSLRLAMAEKSRCFEVEPETRELLSRRFLIF